jgi:hypothetical protein
MFASTRHGSRISVRSAGPRSGIRRALAVGAAVAAAVLLLSGCAAQSSRPTFRTPIEWGGVQKASLDMNDVSTSLRLMDKDRAEVVDFPRGTVSSEKSDGETYTCLDRSSVSPYSGMATWVATGADEIDVKFGRSSIPVFADSDGYIGRTADWGDVRISECGPGAEGNEWILGWVCGYAGKTDDGNLSETCRD